MTHLSTSDEIPRNSLSVKIPEKENLKLYSLVVECGSKSERNLNLYTIVSFESIRSNSPNKMKGLRLKIQV